MTSKSSIDFKDGRINLFHGAGGRAMEELIDELFIKAFSNKWLDKKNDQACFDLPTGRVVMSTDSFVITPLFFPGGNIGSLAIHGTVNDVAMSGAKPLFLSTGFIIEEGYPLADLKKIVDAMAKAAQAADVRIVTGDTKVVEKGKADGVYINTAGIGVILDERLNISADRVQPGDQIIVSGFLGDHGLAVMSQREGFHFESNIESDSAALNDLVASMVAETPAIHCLRDPTRGGLAAVAHEISKAAKVGIRLREVDLPVRTEVQSFCEFLGIDPLYIANEGKLVCFCPAASAPNLLKVMQRHRLGKHAAIVGEVLNDPDQNVSLETEFGSVRMVHNIMGEPLPRIC